MNGLDPYDSAFLHGIQLAAVQARQNAMRSRASLDLGEHRALAVTMLSLMSKGYVLDDDAYSFSLTESGKARAMACKCESST
jgi:hypothetical protein